MRADRMISRLQEGPVLSVVTGVDRGEDRVLHVPVLPAAGYVEELEGDCFPVGRGLRNHPGAISRIAVVPEEESIAIDIQHRDRVVRLARDINFMEVSVSPGSQIGRAHL